MNCDCFKTLIEKLKKDYPEWEDICLDRMFSIITGEGIPFVKCYYKIMQKNKKKYKESSINIKANNCPFCGKEIKVKSIIKRAKELKEE